MDGHRDSRPEAGDELMCPRPQFSLNAILGIVLASSVPLALIAARQAVASSVGISLLPIWFCGSTGHLLGGEKGRHWGLLIGAALQPFAILLACDLWGLLA
jgi:hypothetical protein